jgi:DNA-binding transcriptional MerR regulator
MLRIGHAASETGTTPTKLRYLEQRGLVSPARDRHGHRLYSVHELERVRTVLKWQAAGRLAAIKQRLEPDDPWAGEPDHERALELARRLVADGVTHVRTIREAAEADGLTALDMSKARRALGYDSVPRDEGAYWEWVRPGPENMEKPAA